MKRTGNSWRRLECSDRMHLRVSAFVCDYGCGCVVVVIVVVSSISINGLL